MVGGPQIGYFYPGLTYEMDIHAPGLQWRGVTSAPYPGYMLIGRGADFATTLTASGWTSSTSTPRGCAAAATQVHLQGPVPRMEDFDAGTLNGDPVTFYTTVHGPVVGYARTAHKVAISSKRSSYGKDVLDQLCFRRLSTAGPQSAVRSSTRRR